MEIMVGENRIIYSEDSLRELPVLALAHIGDGVYEILARSRAVSKGAAQVNVLHKRTVKMVSAEAQAKAARLIRETLSEKEMQVFRRGRNTKANHAPPHRTESGVYPLATALETLFGYLYLKGDDGRINELWQLCIASFEEENQ